jgi:O-antigen/teichoic acid export membrane protein
MVLGKLIPLHTLGVYSIAYALSALPQQVIKKISFQVIFPIVSKQADLPRSTLREKIIKQRGKLLIGISLMCIILICFGDKIILFLYDDRYRPAAWMLPLLSSGIWFTMLYATASACLLGLGKPLYDAQSRIVRLLGVTFGLFLGFQIAGIVGAVVVVAFSDIPSYLILQYGLNQEGITFTQQDIKLTLGLTLVIALILGLRFTLGFGHPLEILWTA